MTRAALAALLLLGACTDPPSSNRAAPSADPTTSATTPSTGATTPSTGATSTAASTGPTASATTPWNRARQQADPDRARQQADGNAAPATPTPPAEMALLTAPIASLTPAHGALVRHGTFDATLTLLDAPRAVSLGLALAEAPRAYRAALAFYRLARGVGAHVVPVAVLRAIGVGELAALTASSPEGATVVREARVQNDGTVDALLMQLAPASPSAPVVVDVELGHEVSAWARWAASSAPVAGEDPALLGGYIEMLALDYLAANAVRRRALIAGGALVLADNAAAFPDHPDAGALDRLLRKLRAALRFPRGLLDGLRAFDRGRAAEALAPGGIETWLLSPRARLALDERRAALITLIEARIAEGGRDLVLCL